MPAVARHQAAAAAREPSRAAARHPAAPSRGDAFGLALAAAHAQGGEPGVEFHVFERDDGLVWAVDTAQYFAAPPDWPELERVACAQARGRVLDVGCGAGRHALHLGHQGHDVVGLDSSPGAVAVATARGVQAVQGSLPGPPPGLGRFDTLLLLCNGVALLAAPDRAPAVLGDLAELARPGARLLVAGLDLSLSTAPTVTAYGEDNLRHGRSYGQTGLRIRYDAVATDWFDALVCPPAELEALAAGSPWSFLSVARDGIEYLAVLERS